MTGNLLVLLGAALASALRKALLRLSGLTAVHDEEEAFAARWTVPVGVPVALWISLVRARRLSR